MGQISEELLAIDSILMELHERIRSGRCLTNKLENMLMLNFLHKIANKDEAISKYDACRYVGVSRATFDRLIKDGKLPKGEKRTGFTELFWYPKDLDKYIDNLI